MSDPNPTNTSAASAANAAAAVDTAAAKPSAGAAEASAAVAKPAVGSFEWIKDHLRTAPLLVFFLIAMAITALLNPAKVGLAVWGLAKLGMGGYVGYWIDRIVFPYARPHTQLGIAAGTAWKRRAVIVGAAVVAAALLP
jgi:hypothetical protein